MDPSGLEDQISFPTLATQTEVDHVEKTESNLKAESFTKTKRSLLLQVWTKVSLSGSIPKENILPSKSRSGSVASERKCSGSLYTNPKSRISDINLSTTGKLYLPKHKK
ncbi:unnamed protein product [Lepeophtheirus salmonis]|uniref:(salmon louse) hypothetical protein n=1 Tax=Lepeophtheirus salmonis TaxID=72036 RepID=A0A7R8CXH7_LEPSM|nr:unnamed protein product [Lepeophtheirus salmonis]CAF2960196.1 unnamed protein product [Lepeophtheirus salmonis]